MSPQTQSNGTRYQSDEDKMTHGKDITCDSKDGNEEENQEPAPKPAPLHPVDKGWAWVILAGSWVISFSIIGVFKSYGMFFVEFLSEFKGSVTNTTLLSTSQTLFNCITGIIMLTYGIKHFETRKIVALGVVCLTLGYALTFTAQSLDFLFFSQGFLGGCGTGFVFGPTYVVLNQYFDKRRGLANGIYLSGNSLGGFVIPFIFRYILDEYGLRGSMLLTAGIIFNTLWAVALLRPVGFYSRHQTPNLDHNNDDAEAGHSLINHNHDLQMNHMLQDRRLSNSQPNIATDGNNKFNHLRTRTISVMDESEYRMQGKQTKHRFRTRSKNDMSALRHLSATSVIGISIENLNATQAHTNALQIQEENVGCIESIKRFFRSLFIWDILKNKSYILFMFAYCCGAVCPSFTHIFVAAFAKDTLQDNNQVATILSVISLSDFGGRITVGYISDKKWVNKQFIVMTSQFVIGTMMLFNHFYTEYWQFIIFCLIYGVVFGSMFSLLSPMIVQILGMEEFASGLATLTTLIAVFISLIGPFLGYLKDLTGSYNATLTCMGGFAYGSVILFGAFDVYLRILKRKS